MRETMLTPQQSADGSASIELLGARLLLERDGAIWAPEAGALIVADLHLEKGSSYAARGAHLPPYDTRETLSRVAAAIDRRKPAQLIALGDTFHDRTLDARMAQEDRERLVELVARVPDWVWIVGNHDPAPPQGLGGRACETLRLGPLTLRHEPREGRAGDGEIAGHLHPCARVVGRSRSVRLRCFVSDGRRLVAPALGAYAGGLNVLDPAFAPLLETEPQVFVLGRDRVWPVGAASLVGDARPTGVTRALRRRA